MKTVTRSQLSQQRRRLNLHREGLHSLGLQPDDFDTLDHFYSSILENIDAQIEALPPQEIVKEKMHTIFRSNDPAIIQQYIQKRADKAGNPKVFENLHAFFNSAIYIDAYTDLILIKNIEQEFFDNKLYSGFFKSIMTSEYLQLGTKVVHIIPLVVGVAANVTLPEYATEKANIINDYDL